MSDFPLFVAGEIALDAGVTQELLGKYNTRDALGLRSRGVHFAFAEKTFGGIAGIAQTVGQAYLPPWITQLQLSCESYYNGPGGDSPTQAVQLSGDAGTLTATVVPALSAYAKIVFPAVLVPVGMRDAIVNVQIKPGDSGGIGSRHFARNLYSSSTAGHGLKIL